MELYIHIPFCKSKCAYCDFNSYAECDKGTMFSYLAALNREIEYAGKAYDKCVIDTVYIGGGTPSLLDAKQIATIAENINKNFYCDIKEFTIECNPESVTEEKLEAYKACGINRISLGVQSLDDNNLQSVGRIHTAKLALEKLALVGKYFDNISADLIVGLPYDTMDIIKSEVDTIAPLVSHISMYELSVEDGTPLSKKVKEGSVLLPDDDETQSLFEVAMETARRHGFKRYEISNFAKDGLISKHNYGYWTREQYLGLGAGAHSYVRTSNGVSKLPNELRFASPKDLHQYIAGINCVDAFDKIPRAEISVLDENSIYEEKVMLGLRTYEGIDKKLIEGKNIDDLRVFFDDKDGRIMLNDKGMAV
ncbi:MAG: radical SAM family heme chaperone HemW, partial [Clostridia bacterium]